MPHTDNTRPSRTSVIYGQKRSIGSKTEKIKMFKNCFFKWSKTVKNDWHGNKNMRHGAKNVCHGAKKVRHGGRNVLQGAKTVWHGAKKVWPGVKNVRHVLGRSIMVYSGLVD